MRRRRLLWIRVLWQPSHWKTSSKSKGSFFLPLIPPSTNLHHRHKLISGTGTPVTEESFKKWKAERLSKKEAEEAARKAQEATGRALFEKGGWQNDSSDEDSDDEGDDTGGFDLTKLREETARLLEEREAAEAAAIAARDNAAAGIAGGSA